MSPPFHLSPLFQPLSPCSLSPTTPTPHPPTPQTKIITQTHQAWAYGLRESDSCSNPKTMLLNGLLNRGKLETSEGTGYGVYHKGGSAEDLYNRLRGICHQGQAGQILQFISFWHCRRLGCSCVLSGEAGWWWWGAVCGLEPGEKGVGWDEDRVRGRGVDNVVVIHGDTPGEIHRRVTRRLTTNNSKKERKTRVYLRVSYTGGSKDNDPSSRQHDLSVHHQYGSDFLIIPDNCHDHSYVPHHSDKKTTADLPATSSRHESRRNSHPRQTSQTQTPNQRNIDPPPIPQITSAHCSQHCSWCR